jgi:HEAT repeat protein
VWAGTGSSDGIVELLRDPDALVRLAAADAIAALRPPGSAAAVRAAAARATGDEERRYLLRVADGLEPAGN